MFNSLSIKLRENLWIDETFVLSRLMNSNKKRDDNDDDEEIKLILYAEKYEVKICCKQWCEIMHKFPS